VQPATLLAVPREAPAPAEGMAWVGRAGLAGAGAGQAAVAARVVEELERGPGGDGDVWFKANTTSPLFVNEGVVMGG
jgi:hypothetical protein